MEKTDKSGIIKVHKGKLLKINLQLFGEKDAKNQSIPQLKKGIKNFKKRIKEHKYKINNPEKFYSGWNKVSEKIKRGRLKHWKKEISNFEKSIFERKKILRSYEND